MSILLWINSNQIVTLRYYARAELLGEAIKFPRAIPTFPSFQACMRKKLIQNHPARGYVLTELGHRAMDAYPEPVSRWVSQPQGENV